MVVPRRGRVLPRVFSRRRQGGRVGKVLVEQLRVVLTVRWCTCVWGQCMAARSLSSLVRAASECMVVLSWRLRFLETFCIRVNGVAFVYWSCRSVSR